MKIDSAVVVITGASSGIGRATALAFAREGACVVLASRRADALREVAAECEGVGGQALAVPTDVTDEGAVRELARRAMERFGRIDAWVNNAGVTLLGRIDEVPMEDFRRVFDVNVFGMAHGARAVVPMFREQGHGVIVNVSSQAGVGAQPLTSAYVASKHAIRGLAESLRMELRGTGVEVCTVLPASVDTPLFQHAANWTGRRVQPVGPVYAAEQVARTILDLVRAPRREVFVGSAGRVASFLRNLSPGLYEGLMTRQVESQHLGDEPAREGHGNLYEPQGEARVDGGWGANPKRQRWLRIAGGAAAALAAPYALRRLGWRRAWKLARRVAPIAARGLRPA